MRKLLVLLVLVAGCYTARDVRVGLPIKADIMANGYSPEYTFTVYPPLRKVVGDCLWRDGHTLLRAPGERGPAPVWDPMADDGLVRSTIRKLPPEWIGRAMLDAERRSAETAGRFPPDWGEPSLTHDELVEYHRSVWRDRRRRVAEMQSQ